MRETRIIVDASRLAGLYALGTLLVAGCVTNHTGNDEPDMAVECTANVNCSPGAICDVATGRCVPGCTASHRCGDAGGACELDGGRCVECQRDSECTVVNATYCRPGKYVCVECLPSNDDCPNGEFCSVATYACAIGCKRDGDCPGDVDAGFNSRTRCSLSTGMCVACIGNSDCPMGYKCMRGTCV